MKSLAILFIITINVFAFTLTVNNGVEDAKSYFVVHLEDKNNIECNEKMQENEKKIYICKVSGRLNQDIPNQNLPFMDIKFSQLDDNNYLIVIVPKKHSKLINTSRSLYNNQKTSISNSNLSKHFSIIIDDRINNFPKAHNNGINFDIVFPNLLKPRIGALDLNKEPLAYEPNGDISQYLDIKRNYEQGLYEETLKDSKRAIADYPNSIFASELWLYYLRSLDKLLEAETSYKKSNEYANEIVNVAKNWMRNFSSDINYPEVLFLITDAYIENEMMGDANYFLDILITEHPESNWTKLAILRYADRLFLQGNLADAIRFYEDVLYSSKDLDIASKAAFKLAWANISTQNFNEAKNYINKIINVNDKFLLQNKDKTLEIADSFRDKNMFDIANKLYKIVFDGSKSSDSSYEASLRNLALTLSKTSDYKEAYKYLKQYEKEFPNSNFMPLISSGLDRLFFKLNGKSDEEKHKKYKELIQKYSGLDIGNTALVDEIKLNFSEKNYNEILEYTDKIQDLNDTNISKILFKSAAILANSYNRNGECSKVINLVDKYNILSQIDDKFKLFDCYKRSFKYDKALELATSNTDVSDLNNRIEWLMNLGEILFKLDEYKKSLTACNKAIELSSNVPYSNPSRAIYYKFYSLIKLKHFNEAFAVVPELKKYRGNNLRLVEIYFDGAKSAYDNNNTAVALDYSKKTMNLQERLNIDTFSPDIEFINIDSLIALSKFDKAFEVSQKLLHMNLKPQIRQRALYQMSEILINLNEPQKAKPYIKECIDSNITSSWKSLCDQQEKLINLN